MFFLFCFQFGAYRSREASLYMSCIATSDRRSLNREMASFSSRNYAFSKSKTVDPTKSLSPNPDQEWRTPQVPKQLSADNCNYIASLIPSCSFPYFETYQRGLSWSEPVGPFLPFAAPGCWRFMPMLAFHWQYAAFMYCRLDCSSYDSMKKLVTPVRNSSMTLGKRAPSSKWFR